MDNLQWLICGKTKPNQTKLKIFILNVDAISCVVLVRVCTIMVIAFGNGPDGPSSNPERRYLNVPLV